MGANTPTEAASRRVRRLQTSIQKAYNVFCSAFSLNAALAQCQGLQTAGAIPTGNTVNNAAWDAGTYLFPSLDHCMVRIDLPVANTNCHVTSTGTGHCIKNSGTGPLPSGNGLQEHQACTQHAQVGSTSSYTYTTVTTMDIPAADAPSAANLATAETSSTAVTAATGADTLKTYIVVAAVTIAADPNMLAVVNMTEDFGLTTAQLTAAKTALNAGVTAALTATTQDSALTAAVTAVAAANPTIAAVTVAAAPTTGSGSTGATSSAVQMGAFAALVMALTALFF
jgi:hypothetical protein